jgi:cellulose synthase/poly-beta-1,6-N-acetylglucosamine synthase-like glycosyltransferase
VAPTTPKPRRLAYAAFALPLGLAALSWWGFPPLARWLSITLFNHDPQLQYANPAWSTLVMVFYSWFTFLSIGAGGTLAVGAWLSRRHTTRRPMTFYPMVSFVVPAFNEEQALPRCIRSLTHCAAAYPGPVEIIVVDDGSTDATYDAAYAALHATTPRNLRIRSHVVRHMVNLGKVDALRLGVNGALGQLVAVVDADSWWHPDALRSLVEYLQTDGKVAVTGYVHPAGRGADDNSFVALQQLEYSQGLGIFRCAQALGNAVTVVPGAMGLFKAEMLRDILNGPRLKSVTEDSEITLELQKRGYGVGYLNLARSGTEAPESLGTFWTQRQRWFVGWLHNTLGVHRDMLLKRRWLTVLLWYTLMVEYFGTFIELAAFISFPLLFWLAPDRILFTLNLLWFGAYALLVGVAVQAIALHFAYGKQSYRRLLYYTPFCGSSTFSRGPPASPSTPSATAANGTPAKNPKHLRRRRFSLALQLLNQLHRLPRTLRRARHRRLTQPHFEPAVGAPATPKPLLGHQQPTAPAAHHNHEHRRPYENLFHTNRYLTGDSSGNPAMTTNAALKDLATKYFHKKGYKTEQDIEVEGHSGILRKFDLIITKQDVRHTVHVLDWNRTVGVNQVINIDKASEDINLRKPILISEKFSSHAKSYANRKGITLLTTRDLSKI